MKKICTLIVLFLLNSLFLAQTKDSLFIHYFENNPFSYSDGLSRRGIEIEIMNEYISWLKTNKNIELKIKFVGFNDFEGFLSSIKSANKNTFGLGTLTINQERKKEMDFTDPVLKNVAFCITNGHAPDVTVKNKEELLKVFGKMTAVTLPNSSLHNYLLDLKKSYLPDLQFNFQPNPEKILDEISKNVFQFGFVDAVSFWIYLKNNPGRYLKMQKTLNQSKEELGFALPKNSQHTELFNEFFSGVQGFKFSKTYRGILEKHLGSYMTQNMAIH